MNMGGPDLVMEHRFHHERKWRFDFASTDRKVAIEIEGGVWNRGRHNRPSGFINDCEKYNEAAICGWTVVRLPEPMVNPKYLRRLIDWIKSK